MGHACDVFPQKIRLVKVNNIYSQYIESFKVVDDFSETDSFGDPFNVAERLFNITYDQAYYLFYYELESKAKPKDIAAKIINFVISGGKID